MGTRRVPNRYMYGLAGDSSPRTVRLLGVAPLARTRATGELTATTPTRDGSPDDRRPPRTVPTRSEERAMGALEQVTPRSTRRQVVQAAMLGSVATLVATRNPAAQHRPPRRPQTPQPIRPFPRRCNWRCMRSSIVAWPRRDAWRADRHLVSQGRAPGCTRPGSATWSPVPPSRSTIISASVASPRR